MNALPAHPAIRLPVGRLAPVVAGVAALAAALLVGAIAIIRPGEVATAVVAGGSVVLAVGGMYAALGAIRSRHLLSLTTIFMGLSMARLLASVALGMAYMLTAVTETGGRPDKVVFAVVFLGTSLVVLGVETVLIRSAIQRLGEAAANRSISDTASSAGPVSGGAAQGGRS